MRITAFIPVYSSPRRVAETARILSAENHPGSEIVIVVDGETNAAIDEALDSLRGLPRVRVIAGRPHMGKAAALNQAVSATDSDGILFLDNDICLEPGMRMFAGCETTLGRCDIAEIPKLGMGTGILASMVECEFLANVIATDYLVSREGRCPAMNGAAFVVRRRLFREIGGFRGVVNEDMDFAARAFFAGARTGFEPSLTVHNEVPESFGIWFKQRRRWAINAPLWARVYMPRVKREAPELASGIFKSGLIFPLPFIVASLAALLQFIPGPSHTVVNTVGRAIMALAGLLLFGMTASYFAAGARKFGTRLSLPAYILFSILYLPAWGIAYLLGLVSVLSGKIPDLGWKHDESENLVGMEKPLRRKTRVARSSPNR